MAGGILKLTFHIKEALSNELNIFMMRIEVDRSVIISGKISK
jgi:hypothetical protein